MRGGAREDVGRAAAGKKDVAGGAARVSLQHQIRGSPARGDESAAETIQNFAFLLNFDHKR